MMWQEFKKQWRFFDGVIIVFLIILSFLPLVLFSLNEKNKNIDTTRTIAIVSIDGQEVERFELSEKTAHFEKTYYPKEGQYNIVEMVGNKIRVKEDNSPDQIAVKTGWISQPGQTSICLPHRLVIEIKSAPGSDQDDLIITY